MQVVMQDRRGRLRALLMTTGLVGSDGACGFPFVVCCLSVVLDYSLRRGLVGLRLQCTTNTPIPRLCSSELQVAELASALHG